MAYGYEHKKEHRSEPKVGELLGYYEDDFKKAINNPFEEVVFRKEQKPEQFIDLGVRGIKKYHSDMMPRLNPVEIEQKFDIEFANYDFKFTGVIDLVDDTGIIHDHKTTGKAPSKMQIDNDQQLSAYTAGYKSLTKKKPKSLQLDFLVLSKDPKIVSYKTTRSDEDVNRFLVNLGYVKKAIDAGLFYCIHKADAWVCSKEWCAYEEKGYHKELYKLGVAKFIEKYGNGNSEIIYGK